jgi:hypothetical protein
LLLKLLWAPAAPPTACLSSSNTIRSHLSCCCLHEAHDRDCSPQNKVYVYVWSVYGRAACHHVWFGVPSVECWLMGVLMASMPRQAQLPHDHDSRQHMLRSLQFSVTAAPADGTLMQSGALCWACCTPAGSCKVPSSPFCPCTGCCSPSSPSSTNKDRIYVLCKTAAVRKRFSS